MARKAEHITPAALSALEAGRYIGRSESTILRLVKRGQLTPLDDGIEGMRFRVVDLDAWLERCAIGER